MCAIVAAVMTTDGYKNYMAQLTEVVHKSTERGRDSYGQKWIGHGWQESCKIADMVKLSIPTSVRAQHKLVREHINLTFVAQLRAEPTHEFVKKKTDADVPPFTCGAITLAHNGTIANDNELAFGSHFDRSSNIDSWALAMHLAEAFKSKDYFTIDNLREVMLHVKGSFAVAVTHDDLPGKLLVATNFKPLYYLTLPNKQGFVIASQFKYLEEAFWNNDLRNSIRAVEPYSLMEFHANGDVRSRRLISRRALNKRVLAVCSGGLDSSVAVALLKNQGAEILMLHYLYGSRADAREIQAVTEIARFLGCETRTRVLDLGIKTTSSPLLNPDAVLSRGAKGAEFAYEWVPARNLIMLATAIGIAEAEGFDTICLGNNLEESNSHPDNEMEFVNRLNALIPFSLGVNKNVHIEMPVGNLMKREIIQAGMRLKVPLYHTYSCYEGRELHCGECASCYLRRTAFTIAGVDDPTKYELLNQLERG